MGIHVDADPREFAFRGGGAEMRLAPIVWVTTEGEPIGFGAVQPATDSAEAVTRVDLFRGPSPPGGSDRYRLLVAFFRHALITLLAARVFKVKPVVRFVGLAAFDGALSGYQGGLLRRALLEAGAARVEFAAPTA